MFDEWKRAWRQAVENFRRELADEGGAPPRVRAMERELASASGALARLDEELRRVQRSAAGEREAADVCRRRQRLARDAGDAETAAVAADYAVRHAERSDVFERKASVIGEERTLLAAEVEEMRRLLEEAALRAGVAGGHGSGRGAGTASDTDDDPEFSRLEHAARERAADERLRELKRRMGA